MCPQPVPPAPYPPEPERPGTPLAAAALIARFALQPHPEGGWYRELYRSPRAVRQDGDAIDRRALTTILYLLSAGQRSRWHRLRNADEIWHYSAGSRLELLTLPPAGGRLQRLQLGSALQDPGCDPLAVVPAGCWQAARSLGVWSLMSCTVGPGFDFADFELLADQAAESWPVGVCPDFL